MCFDKCPKFSASNSSVQLGSSLTFFHLFVNHISAVACSHVTPVKQSLLTTVNFHLVEKNNYLATDKCISFYALGRILYALNKLFSSSGVAKNEIKTMRNIDPSINTVLIPILHIIRRLQNILKNLHV